MAARLPPVTGVEDEPPCGVVPVLPAVGAGAGVEVDGDGVGFGLSPLAARISKSAVANSSPNPQEPSLFSYAPTAKTTPGPAGVLLSRVRRSFTSAWPPLTRLPTRTASFSSVTSVHFGWAAEDHSTVM